MYRAIWINLDVDGKILSLHVVLNNVFLKFDVVAILLKSNCFFKKVSQVVHIKSSSSRSSEMLVIDHVSSIASDCLIQE